MAKRSVRKRRNRQTSSQQQQLLSDVAYNEQIPLFNNVALGIQESTMQVPMGSYSMADPQFKVPEFKRAVYWFINWKSNWERGESKALPLTTIAKALGVKSKSQVHRAVKWLIKHGWLKIMGKRDSDGAYFYKVIHHNCDPHEVPLDKDGAPQKCAVPMGINSGFDMLKRGQIHWRVLNQWILAKIGSNWITGLLETTMKEAKKFVRFGISTVSQNYRTMLDVGLLGKRKPKEYIIQPLPYPERRKRQQEDGLDRLPYSRGWYYSYNRLWRLHGENLLIQRKLASGKWSDATENELLNTNRKIYVAFSEFTEVLIRFHSSRVSAHQNAAETLDACT